MNLVAKPPKFILGISQQSWLIEEMIKGVRDFENQSSKRGFEPLPRIKEEDLRKISFAMLDVIYEYYNLEPRKK